MLDFLLPESWTGIGRGLHAILWATIGLWCSGNDAILRLYSVPTTLRTAVILSRGGWGAIRVEGGRFGELIGAGLSLDKIK